VYVLGEFTTIGGANSALSVKEDVGILLSQWKADHTSLLRRFDTDRSGAIDLINYSRHGVCNGGGWDECQLCGFFVDEEEVVYVDGEGRYYVVCVSGQRIHHSNRSIVALNTNLGDEAFCRHC
jgi:hypothetical protein